MPLVNKAGLEWAVCTNAGQITLFTPMETILLITLVVAFLLSSGTFVKWQQNQIPVKLPNFKGGFFLS